jgi:hypothetical protein
VIQARGALIVLILLAGCGAPAPTPVPTLVPTSLPTASRPASPPTTALIVDPALLALVPSAVDGIPIDPSPEAAAEIALDPDLGRSASAIAVGLAIAPGSSASDDLAIVSVVRLRDGIFSEAFFRSWRDTYDSGACERAGGVAGRAESTIGGHRTYIGSCAAGVLTYHVHLAGEGVLVSVTAIGPRRLGELVIAGITE